jgi:nucleoid-associated protein YgaU
MSTGLRQAGAIDAVTPPARSRRPAHGILIGGRSAACATLCGFLLSLLVPFAVAFGGESHETPTEAPSYEQLRTANETLRERVQALEKQLTMATRLDAKASRLAGLAERLEARLAEADESAKAAAADAQAVTPDGTAEGLREELSNAEERAIKAETEVAELTALLKQQRLTVDESLLRADKAEKLQAALEEAHAQLRTENERLTLELATARERQAEAMQRVVELDSLLAASSARAVAEAGAGPTAPTAAAAIIGTEADAAASLPTSAAMASSGGGAQPVVYEVRKQDTLSRIAAQVYGDAADWQRIFDANRDVLDGPDDLTLGMRLIIP